MALQSKLGLLQPKTITENVQVHTEAGFKYSALWSQLEAHADKKIFGYNWPFL